MKCVACGRPLPAVDEDGICPRCGENTKILDMVFRTSRKRYLTQRKFEALLSDLIELAKG
jgi:predicted RNA-binding Zn-ribbon protein involved in translation (DUF1610 family)